VGVKLSVSLPNEDVAFLDEYARSEGIDSRSAVVQKAVQLLRASTLGDAYEDAWSDWEGSADEVAWEAVAGDGLGDAEG
jgi:Arc/MetJ-type ribon-helix-helix transcriptional regulator